VVDLLVIADSAWLGRTYIVPLAFAGTGSRRTGAVRINCVSQEEWDRWVAALPKVRTDFGGSSGGRPGEEASEPTGLDNDHPDTAETGPKEDIVPGAGRKDPWPAVKRQLRPWWAVLGQRALRAALALAVAAVVAWGALTGGAFAIRQIGHVWQRMVSIFDRATLSGVVVDAQTGKPVSGAAVTIGSVPPATADGEGKFRVDVSPGTATLSVTAGGYQTASRTITIGEGDNELGRLRLDRVMTPPVSETIFKEAMRLQRDGRLKDAIAKGREAISIDAKPVYLYTVASWLLLRASKQKESGNRDWMATGQSGLALANQAASMSPHDANALATLAGAAAFMGDRETAIWKAREALQYDPKNELAKMVLGKYGEK